MAPESLVIVEEREGIATLSLNRVDKHNALSKDLINELHGTLIELGKAGASHKIRALIVKSNSEKAFCAGADLKERMAMNSKEVSETLASQRKLMTAMALVPVPTLAVIRGVAFGGGLELSLCCDLRLCSSNAEMALTETKLAIIPGAGGTQRLTRLIGTARAKELIFRAKKVSASEALSLGLVNGVFDEPYEEAWQWAKEIAANGPIAVNAAKAAIDRAIDLELEQGLDWERACYQRTLDSSDRLEGLKAFSEKRKPAYTGE